MSNEVPPELLFAAALASNLKNIESTVDRSDGSSGQISREAYQTINRVGQQLRMAQRGIIPGRTAPQPSHILPQLVQEELGGIEIPTDTSIKFNELPQGVEMPGQVQFTGAHTRVESGPRVVQAPPVQITKEPDLFDHANSKNKVAEEIENVYYAVKRLDEGLQKRHDEIKAGFHDIGMQLECLNQNIRELIDILTNKA